MLAGRVAAIDTILVIVVVIVVVEMLSFQRMHRELFARNRTNKAAAICIFVLHVQLQLDTSYYCGFSCRREKKIPYEICMKTTVIRSVHWIKHIEHAC